MSTQFVTRRPQYLMETYLHLPDEDPMEVTDEGEPMELVNQDETQQGSEIT